MSTLINSLINRDLLKSHSVEGNLPCPVLFRPHNSSSVHRTENVPIIIHGDRVQPCTVRKACDDCPGRDWKDLKMVINGGESSALVEKELNVLRLPKWLLIAQVTHRRSLTDRPNPVLS